MTNISISICEIQILFTLYLLFDKGTFPINKTKERGCFSFAFKPINHIFAFQYKIHKLKYQYNGKLRRYKCRFSNSF